MLLTLGSGIGTEKPQAPDFVTFKATNSEEAQTPEVEPDEKVPARPTPQALPQPQADPVPRPPVPEIQPPVQPPVPPAQAIIPLSPRQMASSDISSRIQGPPPPAKQTYGPPDTRGNSGDSGDSQRVSGTAPNGEPLYRATWYREPTQSELAGYLSTAVGPGWALISCRTVADFRVEDCVLEGEFPPSSNMGRAVLAAAWQFRVRPPRIGGRPQVGAWVRIRIDYTRR